MAQSPTNSAVRALQLELKKIQDEPVEGFRISLVNDDNIFEWEVAIFGPLGRCMRLDISRYKAKITI